MAATGTTTRKTKPAPKPAPKGKETVGINVAIPAALHTRLRIKTINDGLSMSEAIEAALRAWLR